MQIARITQQCKGQHRATHISSLGYLCWNTEFIDHNLKTEFVRHNLVHKTEFVDSNLKFAKQMTPPKKNQRSEFDDRIGIVHRICKSQFSAQNRICGQQFEVRI